MSLCTCDFTGPNLHCFAHGAMNKIHNEIKALKEQILCKNTTCPVTIEHSNVWCDSIVKKITKDRDGYKVSFQDVCKEITRYKEVLNEAVDWLCPHSLIEIKNLELDRREWCSVCSNYVRSTEELTLRDRVYKFLKDNE